MGAIEIIVIIFCVLIVGGVIAKSIIDKKNGKKGCQSGCSCCKYANNCIDNRKNAKN